jgi:hypothetical protein
VAAGDGGAEALEPVLEPVLGVGACGAGASGLARRVLADDDAGRMASARVLVWAEMPNVLVRVER